MQTTPRRLTLTILLIFLGLWLAVMAVALPLAALPDSTGGRVLVVFSPRFSPEARLLAIAAADGRPILHHLGGILWLADSDTAGFVGRLKTAGAWAAYAPETLSVLPQGGCFYVSVHPPGPPRPRPPI